MSEAQSIDYSVEADMHRAALQQILGESYTGPAVPELHEDGDVHYFGLSEGPFTVRAIITARNCDQGPFYKPKEPLFTE